ncbi:MAG: bifunctional oligoribonuclease/PAP phosphatase NrnA [Clostridia bacterium]|nr:bifunctional oligoribonuclease/PAP phosphatase NrnA [Clostridia bacterium]
MFEEALREIDNHKVIIIHRHTNPDGDALGSQIGLKHIILNNFKDKEVYMVGDPAKRYDFMDDSVMDEVEDDKYKDALAIVLDTSAKSLINDERYMSANKTIRFDHHIFVEKICDIEYVDTSFESCCGLITKFAKVNNLKLNELAAKSLYTGMVTDSGRFRYDSTTSQTFDMASFLMNEKFDTGSIFTNLYANELDSVKLRAEFTLKIKLTEKNVAYIYTTYDEFKASGADSFTISRGMVNTMGDLKGVDIWVNFTEIENAVLCELRSTLYNINQIAVNYGGGGHLKASGATLKNKEEAMAMLEDLNNLIGA